jgi:hypothetical protein
VEKNDILKRVLEDDDFIHAPKFGNSLNKFLAKAEKLPHNGTIGKLLLIPESEVERLYEESVVELRKEMVQDDDDSEDISDQRTE